MALFIVANVILKILYNCLLYVILKILYNCLLLCNHNNSTIIEEQKILLIQAT